MEHLGIEQFFDVQNLLNKHGFTTSHFDKLGPALDLSANTLNAIEANCRGDVTRCLIDTLAAWLRQADQVKERGGPTHHTLIKALKEIGEVATADRIDKEVHPACCILQKYISNASIKEALPRLVLFLHEEGFIKKKILPTTGELLLAVQESVCADYHNLEKFGAMLQELSSTKEIGTLIRKDYMNEFSSSTSMNDNQSTSADSPAPAVNVIRIPSVAEFEKMRGKYTSVVTDACKAMSIIPPDELKKYLRLGYRYLAPQLVSMVTTDDMLMLVCDQCSLIDLSILENVAHHFNIEEAITLIEGYKKNVDEFNPCVLQDFTDIELFPGSPLKSKTITFIVDRSVDDYTIEDVRLLLNYAFRDLAPHVKIVVIKECNSFIVPCSFPEENIELLKEKGVTKLTIGCCTVYDSEEVTCKNDKEKQWSEAKSSLDQDDYNSQTSKQFKQLMLSQNVQLLNKEQEVINTREEIQKLEIQIEELVSDKALNDYHSVKKKDEKLSKKRKVTKLIQ